MFLKRMVLCSLILLFACNSHASISDSIKDGIKSDVLNAIIGWDCSKIGITGKLECSPIIIQSIQTKPKIDYKKKWSHALYTKKEKYGAYSVILAIILDSLSTYHVIHNKDGNEVGLISSKVIGAKPNGLEIAAYGIARVAIWFGLCEIFPKLREFAPYFAAGTMSAAIWNTTQ